MTNKLQFNLDLWKIGKYDVVTRDDRKAKIVYVHDDLTITYPIASIIFNENAFIVNIFNIKGQDDLDNESNDDLFLILKKKKLWIVIAKNKNYTGSYATSHAYESPECIKAESDSQLIEIEIEDLE